MPFIIEPMTLDDVDTVSAIEKECFSLTWPASAYRREIRDQSSSRYIVARYVPSDGSPSPSSDAGRHRGFLSNIFGLRQQAETQPGRGQIVGFAGLWMRLDEAHVTTIGVRPDYRGMGIGELLLAALFDITLDMGGSWLTLEVRVTNVVAHSLYRKYTFREAGVRKRYYSDNGEDALIMWSESIVSADFQHRFAHLKEELIHRLGEAEAEMMRAT